MRATQVHRLPTIYFAFINISFQTNGTKEGPSGSVSPTGVEDPNGFSRWVLNVDPTETSDVGILSQVSDFALKKGGEHEG